MRKLITLALILIAQTTNAQSTDAIRAHVKFLASDAVEGRGTGTRGYAVAAEYVATQFRIHGLEAQFQPIKFRTTVRETSSTMTIERDGAPPVVWKYGEQFATYGDALREDTTASGRVVFVGYGVTTRDGKYDDYAKINAKGKIVAYLTGAPNTMTSEVRAHYSSSLNKMETAVAHGAIGTITIFGPYDQNIPWTAITRRAEQGQMHWLEANGTPHATRREILAGAILSKAGAESLFSSSPFTLSDVYTQAANGTVRSFDLPLRASIHVLSQHGESVSSNVIGVLRGRDPKLRDEYLVYSGHLDHLGITSPVNGDTINNGALDNASGIAAMIEIARLLAVAKPRRSVLFLATTGEEKGLRGADYFANNPTVPAKSIVADINLDEILMMTPVTDVVALGGDHSDLGEVVARAAKSAGVTVSPDPYPEEANFVRSDQYPFVRVGIPSIYIGAGYHAADSKIDAQKLQLAWIGTLYHTPQDDLSQPIDFSVGAMVAKVALKAGEMVANRDARPRWKPGDFFAR